jgi:hypothetical protein
MYYVRVLRVDAKLSEASEIEKQILSDLLDDDTDNDVYKKANNVLYYQLLFLWAFNKEYSIAILFQDPPELDLAQGATEDDSNLLNFATEMDKEYPRANISTSSP